MIQISPERWRLLEPILDEALELPAAARPAYLDVACAGDPALRARVAALLEADSSAGSFLEGSVGEYAGSLVPERPGAGDVPAVAPSLDGERVGPYRVVRELARGGMGAVYLGERADGQFEQRVALKLIKRGMDSDTILRRFLHERQILARLEHPNLARLLDGGVTPGGQPWFAMEYVDGVPITTYCDERRLEVDARLRLFLSVGEAVRYAHRNLVVHRDLKPSNILVTPDGEVRLLDFGIAKVLHEDDEETRLTRAGVRVMTPEYAAPEQVKGEPVTTATDVYALGILLYELITGHRPYRLARQTPAEVERVVCEHTPAPPSTAVVRTEELRRPDGSVERIGPESVARLRGTHAERLRRQLAGDLDTIVLKALAKEPERRYASAEALLEDVQRHLQGLPIRARQESLGYRMRKFVWRHRVGVASGVVVLLALVGGLAAAAWQARVASHEATKARAVNEFLVSLFRGADPAESRGREITASELLGRGAARVERELAGQPEVQAELFRALGEIHRELGLYERADSLLARAVTRWRTARGDAHPELARSLHDRATVLTLMGRYAAAEPLFRHALAMRRDLRGDHHPDVAATLHEMAGLRRATGDRPRAESLYTRSLAIDRAHYGGDHLQVATHLSALGVLFAEQGDWARADSAYQAALAIRRKHLDEDHPLVVTVLHNLATLRLDQGEFAEAERLHREVLRKRRTLFRGAHPDVARTLSGLAVVLERQGKYDEAERAEREALALRRALLGATHSDVAASLNNLAVVQYRMAAYDSAERSMRQVLALWRQSLGPKHPNTLSALNNLGAILSDRGAYRAAEPLLREALAARRAVFGATHPDVLPSVRNVGVLLHRTGRLEAAERTLREAVRIARDVFPGGHPTHAAQRVALGEVLTDRGRPTEAEPLLREAVTLLVKTFGERTWRTAEAKRALGTCLAAQGRYAEAERLLLDSYRAYQSDRFKVAEVRETARRLTRLYRAWGKPRKAAEYGAATLPS